MRYARLIESLETRRLLSSASVKAGVLNIRGEVETPNTIVVSLNGSNVRVVINGGASADFDPANFTQITIRGGIVADTVISSNYLGKLFRIYTYGGNDTVVMGGDNSLIRAGKGADTVTGSGGKDRIWGGEGGDSLDGGAGNDTIHGWDGNDTIRGSAGNDLIFGGLGTDSLDGGSGNDTLLGGSGNDTYAPGPGTNLVFAILGGNTINIDLTGVDTIWTNASSIVNNATSSTSVHRNVIKSDNNGESGSE
ncbi:MAG: hypothetical protein QM770_21850 [Tepidisphaeraceae bacterium]